MNRFFVNKYPIDLGNDDIGKPLSLQSGTIFTIVGISGNMFELEPVSKIVWLEFPVFVDALMLEKGFTAQDHIAT